MDCRQVYLHGLCVVMFFLCSVASARALPPLTLAQVYSDDVSIEVYWVSEKLDGVRAYWDGQHLKSRSGHIFHAPDWFTRGFPGQTLDGELWSGRGAFEQTVSIVRSLDAGLRWKAITYQVFDLPSAEGSFTQRLSLLDEIVETAKVIWLKRVKQERFSDKEALMQRLDQVVSAGGEGLMLRHSEASYRSGRRKDLLKLKPFLDAEAIVLGHLPGKGQLGGLMGALQVRTTTGKRFKIGTGFSLLERQTPPAIGTVITYRYHGLTSKGIPRFASFLRIRPDE
ncbi:MAG: DNA ligase [Gammaproteobacteria bacterium]